MKQTRRTASLNPWLTLCLVACSASALAASSPEATSGATVKQSDSAMSAEPVDPRLWLEDVNGERAMMWVQAENKKTLGVLEQDPRFQGMFAAALAIGQAHDRIPYPGFEHKAIFNFWQDDKHVRGLWRQTTLADYRSATPTWTTVLDLDALATAESANWVWTGADCLRPAEQRCLITLSDGGEDAQTVREFDLASRQFVKDGFVLPTSKQTAAWIDRDHLLVGRDWGAGTMTASGYPYIVKILARGQELASAREVFRGQADDVGVNAQLLEDGAGHRVNLIERYLNFFESEFYLITADGPKHLNLPKKASVNALVANQLLIVIKEPWTVGEHHFAPGSLVSVDLKAALADAGHLVARLVYEPGAREALDGVSATRSRVIVTLTHNVRGRALVFSPRRTVTGAGGKLRCPINQASM